MAEIHDVYIEKKIQWVGGRQEEYIRENDQFHKFQKAWYENQVDRGLLSRMYVPTRFIDLPLHLSDLPTHFIKIEGRHRSKPIEIVRCEQDVLPCYSKDEKCFTFNNRGYFCSKHQT